MMSKVKTIVMKRSLNNAENIFILFIFLGKIVEVNGLNEVKL